MPLDLNGKVAIITGGARGIAKEYAKALIQRGCKVCLTDILVEEGKAFAQELTTEYGADSAKFVPCNVTVEKEFEAVFEEVFKWKGRLDILVNNAGIVDEISWRRTIDVNLTAVILGTKLGLRFMGKNFGGKGGTIVNVASILGIYPSEDVPVYTATKHGVVGLTRSYGTPLHLTNTGVSLAAICPVKVVTELVHSCLDISLYPGHKVKTLLELPEVTTSFVAGGLIKILEDGINGGILKVTDKGYEYANP